MPAEQNKREQITRLLETAILAGVLAPGTRLPEMRLARALGVSQAIVREALGELERRGLIVKVAGQGSDVVRLTASDLVHIYAVRQELEGLACAGVASALNANTTDALQACLKAMREAAVAHDFAAFSAADVRFHRQIWAAQPNRFLEKSLEAICLPLFAYDRIGRSATSTIDYPRVLRQHELILAAICTREPATAARVMRRLMQRWQRIHLADIARIETPAEQDADAMLLAVQRFGRDLSASSSK